MSKLRGAVERQTHLTAGTEFVPLTWTASWFGVTLPCTTISALSAARAALVRTSELIEFPISVSVFPFLMTVAPTRARQARRGGAGSLSEANQERSHLGKAERQAQASEFPRGLYT